MCAGCYGKGGGKNSNFKNSIQYGGLLFTCVVNSVEKERKMAHKDKYYSRIQYI